MTRSILIGLDGSPYSHSALELGIRWAQKHNALLVGLGVIDEPSIRQSSAVPIGGSAFKERRDETLVSEARRTVERFLSEFSRRCAEAGVSSKQLEDIGVPAEQICLEAQRYDLVLLGKQTYYHFETQNKPDDTLTDVLKQSPRPVVTVPDKLGTGKSVVIAYDGSLQAARTLKAFQSSHLELGEAVHVVAVHADAAAGTRHAERAIDFLRFHEVAAQRHVVTSSSPAQALIEQARKLDAGLVVMGAYGQPAIREFFFGSVTQSLLQDKTFPLFLYH